jgi:hypothetical protein
MLLRKFMLIAILLNLLLLNSEAWAQRKVYIGDEDFQSRWVLGGGFGLSFSTYGSNIQVSPQLGYRLTPSFESGLRLTYNYYSYRENWLRFNTHNFGGGPYASFAIYRGLFAHAEYEVLSYERVFVNWALREVSHRDRILIHSVFVGAGYRQYFSQRSYASFIVMFNLNETLDTPYSNPTFRVGFGIGL